MQQQWADYRVFLKEFRRTFESTGAVMPSGARLSAALAHFVREGAAAGPVQPRRDGEAIFARRDGEAICGGRRILEVGPGTGAVTAHIVRALRSGDRFDLVERNEEFVARLRERLQSDPSLVPYAERIALHHAGVEELSEDEPYDVIVSGLPLNNFPVSLVETLVDKLQRLLKPGGTLSFFEYIAIRRMKAAISPRAERERLRAIGKLLDRFLAEHEIRRDRVFVNVPPAWVHHVRVGAGSTEQGAGSKTPGSMLHAPGSALQ